MSLRDILGGYGVSQRAGAGEIMAGVEEALEVAAGAAAIGALEQRYGESKMTAFMTAQTNADGTVQKDAKGNTLYKSGTGVPYSALGAVGGIVATALVPMGPGVRRRVTNFATGLGAAFAYRKGIEWGQKWLDSKQTTNPQTAAPMPPFAQSVSAQAEQTAIQGELSPGGNVISIESAIAEANKVLQNRAVNGR